MSSNSRFFDCDITAALEGGLSDRSDMDMDSFLNDSWPESLDLDSGRFPRRSRREPRNKEDSYFLDEYPKQPGFKAHHYRLRVTHVETVDSFYMRSRSKQPIRLHSMTLSGIKPLELSELEIGKPCAFFEAWEHPDGHTNQFWSRGKIIAVAPEGGGVGSMVKIYLVDSGKTVQVPIDDSGSISCLKPLPFSGSDCHPLAYRFRFVGAPAAELERVFNSGVDPTAVLIPGWEFKILIDLDESGSGEGLEGEKAWAICSIKPLCLKGNVRPVEDRDFADLCDRTIRQVRSGQRNKRRSPKKARVKASSSSEDSDEAEFDRIVTIRGPIKIRIF